MLPIDDDIQDIINWIHRMNPVGARFWTPYRVIMFAMYRESYPTDPLPGWSGPSVEKALEICERAHLARGRGYDNWESTEW